jgi:anti-anti-sigma factor
MGQPDTRRWHLSVEHQPHEAVSILILRGRVTMASTAQLREAVASARAGGRPCIVDLSGVDYVSGEGVSVLTAVSRDAAAGAVVFCCWQDPVRIAFELAGAAGDLRVEATREEAVRGVSAGFR